MLCPRGVVIDQELSSTAAPLTAADVPASASEAQIIAECRSGNTAAWHSLFDKYYATVARFVFQLSGDFSHEDTEEICQETFVAVVRNLSSFQGRSSFQTWLLRIAANKAMDFREKSRAAKRGGSVMHVSLEPRANENDLAFDPPSPNPGPDKLLQISEM